jgi:conjugative transfer pilus assembly protein TraH
MMTRSHRMKRLWMTACRIALLVAVTGVMHLHDARAQVAQQSQDLFNNIMVNTTNPQIAMDARRGVITGGSLSIRFPVQNVPLYNVQLPRLDVGCGGIDAFMGSFSFISGDQLVAALRNIAQAALGYAFQLALTAMCPTCADIMSKMQAMMNSFNSGQMNSCQIAKSIMDSTGASAGITSAFTSIGQQTGVSGWSDYFDTKLQGQTNQSTSSVFAAFAPQQAQSMMWGNVVWRTMQQSNAAGAFLIDGNTNLLEDLMSVTGTVIVCMQGVLGCAQGDTSQQQYGPPAAETAQRFEPLLTVDQIVNGIASSPGVPKYYHCDTSTGPYSCLQPSATPITNMVGVKTLIENMMLGTGGSEGMIDAIYSGDRQPTNAENSLMVAGGEYVQLAMKLARKNPTAAKDFVMMFSRVMATAFVTQLIDTDLAVVLQGMSGQNQLGVDAGKLKEAREMVQKADSDAHKALIVAYKDAQNNSAVLDFYHKQVLVMDKSNPPPQPVGNQ